MNKLWLAVAVGAMSVGCISIGSNTRAESMGKGNVEGGVEPGALISRPLDTRTGIAPTNLPSVNGFIRFGLSDRIDLGFKLGTQLAEINTKFMLTSPDSRLLVVSLAPSVNGFGAGLTDGVSTIGFGFVNIAVPVLVGFKLGAHELTLGPRLNNFLLFGQAASGSSSTSGVGYAMVPGMSLGFAARITEHFEMMPEVAIAVPVFSSASASSGGVNSGATAVTAGQSLLVSATLGFKFGKLKQRSTLPPERAATTDSADPGPPPPTPPPAAPPPAPSDSLPPPPPPPPAPPST